MNSYTKALKSFPLKSKLEQQDMIFSRFLCLILLKALHSLQKLFIAPCFVRSITSRSAPTSMSSPQSESTLDVMPVDEWRAAAETNDALVADLLLQIKHSTITWTATTTRTNLKPTVTSASSSGGLLPFRWGRRKARSRSGVTRFVTNEEKSTRSPTTPLSWSGGCGGASVSGSGNGDGYEASSMMCQKSTGCRSKITAAYDLSNGKRAQRKKTYIELKEEECVLLHERLNLKRDLATLHSTLTDYRMTNQNLKRIKSMNVQSGRMITSAAAHPLVFGSTQTITSMIQVSSLPSTARRATNNEILQPPHTCFSLQEEDRKSFMLPDLNMPPSTD